MAGCPCPNVTCLKQMLPWAEGRRAPNKKTLFCIHISTRMWVYLTQTGDVTILHKPVHISQYKLQTAWSFRLAIAQRHIAISDVEKTTSFSTMIWQWLKTDYKTPKLLVMCHFVALTSVPFRNGWQNCDKCRWKPDNMAIKSAKQCDK